MKKKIFMSTALIGILSMSLIVNAQEVSENGYNSVPVNYSASTFTVVLPDSIDIGASKTQEFEICLSDYDLQEGEGVSVKPTANKIKMNNIPTISDYYVGDKAYYYNDFPDFPTVKSLDGQWVIYDGYITTMSDGYTYLYCCPTGETPTSFAIDSSSNYISRSSNWSYYTKSEAKPENLSTTEGDITFHRYRKNNGKWDYNGSSKLDTTTVNIIQSTHPIYDENGEIYIHKSTILDPVNINVSMENEILTDNTPIKGTIDATALPDGNWEGHILFEISVVNTN